MLTRQTIVHLIYSSPNTSRVKSAGPLFLVSWSKVQCQEARKKKVRQEKNWNKEESLCSICKYIVCQSIYESTFWSQWNFGASVPSPTHISLWLEVLPWKISLGKTLFCSTCNCHLSSKSNLNPIPSLFHIFKSCTASPLVVIIGANFGPRV